MEVSGFDSREIYFFFLAEHTPLLGPIHLPIHIIKGPSAADKEVGTCSYPPASSVAVYCLEL
jgi:hypothetical protein